MPHSRWEIHRLRSVSLHLKCISGKTIYWLWLFYPVSQSLTFFFSNWTLPFYSSCPLAPGTGVWLCLPSWCSAPWAMSQPNNLWVLISVSSQFTLGAILSNMAASTLVGWFALFVSSFQLFCSCDSSVPSTNCVCVCVCVLKKFIFSTGASDSSLSSYLPGRLRSGRMAVPGQSGK
jgi:hypothetical protein